MTWKSLFCLQPSGSQQEERPLVEVPPTPKPAPPLSRNHEFFNSCPYRYLVCRILDSKRVPFVVWMDDVEHYYRFGHLSSLDLNILVHDFDAAVAALAPFGFAVNGNEAEINGTAVRSDQRRLSLDLNWRTWGAYRQLRGGWDVRSAKWEAKLDTREEPTVPFELVLLHDRDWHYDVTRHHEFGTHEGPLPPLAAYIEALMYEVLDGADPAGKLPMRHLANVYAKNGGGRRAAVVSDPGFILQLAPKLRVFHLDCIGGEAWMPGYIRRRREVRRCYARHSSHSLPRLDDDNAEKYVGVDDKPYLIV